MMALYPPHKLINVLHTEDANPYASIDLHFANSLVSPIALDDNNRTVLFWLLASLSMLQRQGNACADLSTLAGASYLCVKQDSKTTTLNVVVECFPSLQVLLDILTSALNDDVVGALLVLDKTRLYTKRYWTFEQDIANYIRENSHIESLTEEQISRVARHWSVMFPTSVQTEQDWQQVAVAKSLLQRFSVINGGPGTGKTYTVTRLLLALQCVDHQPKHIVLAAPTGKAQQRMVESINNSLEQLGNRIPDTVKASLPRQAFTLHKLLGLKEHSLDTRFDHVKPLKLDVLIVDEASMIDLALMARLMRAMPPHARLYLIGDADQLPAVETGNVLEQLVGDNTASRSAPQVVCQQVSDLCPHLPPLNSNANSRSWVHTLLASQRFKGDLATLAGAIQKGDADKSYAILVKQSSSELALPGETTAFCSMIDLDIKALKKLAKTSFEFVAESHSAKQALDRIGQIRWLTPVRKGQFGVEGLNRLVTSTLRGTSTTPERFYRGQPVMVVKNNYAQKLSNGEVGIIWPDKRGTLKAWFESDSGLLRTISLSRLPEVETVYAMTVHKSQGSEFDQVVMFLPQCNESNLTSVGHRGILYTGITRAKKGCLTVASQHTFKTMINTQAARFSGLNDALDLQT